LEVLEQGTFFCLALVRPSAYITAWFGFTAMLLKGSGHVAEDGRRLDQAVSFNKRGFFGFWK
jgi:hypothetical protein